VHVERHIDLLLAAIDHQVGYDVRACVSVADVPDWSAIHRRRAGALWQSVHTSNRITLPAEDIQEPPAATQGA